jgi:DNA-damage-inducible protein J
LRLFWLKTRATQALDRVGLSMSDAVRILLTRVAAEGGLPAGLASDPQAHDAWFRAKVREALDETGPGLPHDQVMAEAQALIDRQRNARS